MCPISGVDDTKETKITHCCSPHLFISLENIIFYDSKNLGSGKTYKKEYKNVMPSFITEYIFEHCDRFTFDQKRVQRYVCVCVCMSLPKSTKH